MMDADTARWVATQCHGIASGIDHIHHHIRMRDAEVGEERRYGRHGDIKPRNMLWFSNPDNPTDRGILKITDFGIAELNSKHSRSKRANWSIQFSMSYHPPECDIPGELISRSFDIWTLGCLYLEFLAWLLGGHQLFNKFLKSRLKPVPAFPDTEGDAFFEIMRYQNTDTLVAAVKKEVTDVSTPVLLLDLRTTHAHVLPADH